MARRLRSILNALLATTAIEWTDTPHTADSILEWLGEHETVLVAEERGGGRRRRCIRVVPRCRKAAWLPVHCRKHGARTRGPLGFGSWPRAHGSTHR